MDIVDFFERAYSSTERYWWKGPNRYSAVPRDHRTSLLTQVLLRHVVSAQPGRALDLGCGEGADAIRLAKLGWRVDALDLSAVAVEKARRFAAQENCEINAVAGDALSFDAADESYDLVICNGVLHYVQDKTRLLDTMGRVTKPGGCHVVSTWSTYTPVPEVHRIIPTFPDNEEGAVSAAYRDWEDHLFYYERAKAETSHDELGGHVHSYIKLMALKPIRLAIP